MGCMLLCMEKVSIAVTYNSGSVNSSTLSVPLKCILCDACLVFTQELINTAVLLWQV